MEYIKKEIKLITTTGTTTSDNEYVIVPDESINYNFKIQITSKSINYGFFGVDNFLDGNDQDLHVVSGETFSRLSELRKTINNGDLEDKYFISTDINVNGLNVNESISGDTYVYYIDKIKYVDDVESNITYFYGESYGLNSINSINGNIYKDSSLIDNISKPLIKKDLFIDRPQVNVVEPFFRMKDINELSDLEYYVGGSYYNIYKNE
jgi:hypothetical protein